MARRNSTSKKPDPPPWRWFVVFTPNGEPTGWAMGMDEDHAIRAWFATDRLSAADVGLRGSGFAQAGYTVRPVDLYPVKPAEIEDDLAALALGGRFGSMVSEVVAYLLTRSIDDMARAGMLPPKRP